MRTEPPAWLDPDGADLWRRLVSRVAATDAARRDLAAYCFTRAWWQRTREVAAQLSPAEHQVCLSTGTPRPHPAVLLERELAGELFALAEALGLEPDGRPTRRPTTILFLDEGV